MKKKGKKKNTRSRGYLLTLPRFIRNEEGNITKKITLKEVYEAFKNYDLLVFQIEKGQESDYIHYQIYIENKNPITFSTIKNKFNMAHIEAREGTRKEAFDYCTKEDTRIKGPFIFGDKKLINSRQGERRDIDEFVEAIKSGLPRFQLIEEFPAQYNNFNKLMYDLRSEIAKKNYVEEAREVIVIYGPSGSGKSRYAREKYPDHYVVSNYGNGAFDNYDLQETIIFEEYRSNFLMSELLQITDRYLNQLKARYNDKPGTYKRVVIISNVPLNDLYPSLDQMTKEAFYRRITQYIIFGYERVDICDMVAMSKTSIDNPYFIEEKETTTDRLDFLNSFLATDIALRIQEKNKNNVVDIEKYKLIETLHRIM